MSSILKSILMLQKNIIPPQAGIPHNMNPNVSKFLQKDSNIIIPTKAIEFERMAEKPKRILVNNFDAAGGNACVILEEYKQDPIKKCGNDSRLTHVITTSARTQSSYLANIRRLAGWLRRNPNTRIQDIAYSTTARRVHHSIRFALTASTTQEAVSKLEAEIERASTSSAKSAPINVVFVFTGQ